MLKSFTTPKLKMEEKRLKIVFVILSVVVLAIMLLISRDAGISGDEEVHYKQSEMVFDYFASMGKDKSAVNTPKTHLQYYGQAFDNFTTILIHFFGIDDIYTFRHIMSTLAGWLTIIIAALFAASIGGYSAAIIVLLLFAVSPTFMGHAQNNLKDIPFALAYISSIYFSMKFVFDEKKSGFKTISLLTISMGLSFGIRAGGFLVFFFLWLLLFLKFITNYLNSIEITFKQIINEFIKYVLISIAAFILGIILWPYALENPFANTWKSYVVMTKFPTTVRQIFEGNFDWSDFVPWYYIPKYMAITIPLIVFSGIGSIFFAYSKYSSVSKIKILFLTFTILFPIVFVVFKQPNLYGAWRHFLFIYPGIIILSALGIDWLIKLFKRRIYKSLIVFCFLALSFHPLKFMVNNHPYYYLYYNQLIGGINGAYGNYETDYYYHSMREASEWLNNYLKNNADSIIPEQTKSSTIVAGNFSSQWHFRNDNNIIFKYIAYAELSKHDWDYAIIANSYIHPFQLKNRIYPPENTIHTIFVDNVPVCAVIKRVSKTDKLAIDEFSNLNYLLADSLFVQALIENPENELLYIKFAELLVIQKKFELAKQILNKCIVLNPWYEQALVLQGDIARIENNSLIAAEYYKKALISNRKYFAVYPKLADIYSETNIKDARNLLYDCLKINPKYIPVLKLLAESYRETDPKTAAKYDNYINTIK